MRHSRAVILLGITTLALALASCSDSQAGTPRPERDTGESTTTSEEVPTTSSGSGEDDLPANGAPKVENPIDVAKFEQQPCLALTDDQVRQAGLVPPGEQGEGAFGPSCNWRNRESGANINLQVGDPGRRGLTAVYAGNEAGKFDLWIKLEPIEGFPAVVADIRDLRDSGECPITVGTSDEVTFSLSAKLSDAKIGKTDPCDAAVQVTALVLQTMKANS
ncbi:MAG: DUF3558 domain-containing protein [Actinophytocola sp.]|uniref:DUF3558 domain-containing protein n=1 Tax=Actinophytocola sp. TaxID=1872138 RepID=UPI003C765BF1